MNKPITPGQRLCLNCEWMQPRNGDRECTAAMVFFCGLGSANANYRKSFRDISACFEWEKLDGRSTEAR